MKQRVKVILRILLGVTFLVWLTTTAYGGVLALQKKEIIVIVKDKWESTSVRHKYNKITTRNEVELCKADDITQCHTILVRRLSGWEVGGRYKMVLREADFIKDSVVVSHVISFSVLLVFGLYLLFLGIVWLFKGGDE